MDTSGRTAITVLGSTGSIGQNTLDVVSRLDGRFSVFGLSAGRNVDLLAEQVLRWKPKRVVVAASAEADRLHALVRGRWSGEIDRGDTGIVDLAADPGAAIVVNGLVGARGLRPTFRALETGHRVALANKESLVIAGSLLRRLVDSGSGEIVPVDSEHSALFQLLLGRARSEVSKIILTASGGPFRETPIEELAGVTAEQALRHPTWRMGPRITVDSATLMNKGLEVIEAHAIFGFPTEAIDVWIHPQSIVHGAVELVDGSLIAQLSTPDMRIPIQYALTHPERPPLSVTPCSLPDLKRLDFEAPEPSRYPCFDLALSAVRSGGLYPAVLNAADEVAVEAFLRHEMPFTQIPAVLGDVLAAFPGGDAGSVEQILEADRWAREEAGSLASSRS